VSTPNRMVRARSGAILLDVPRFEQPDDVTCGPTCLTQVYRYYGHEKSLKDVIRETPRNPDGGTLAVYLGIDAIRNGFHSVIYSYNLRVFDQTWSAFSLPQLIRKLGERKEAVTSKRLRRSIDAYVHYLELGGEVRFDEYRKQLLIDILASGRPILTGLSATYLYQTPREIDNKYDDIHGEPAGHFVVICGYDPETDQFIVRDPASTIPFSRSGKYSVPAERLTASILLGDVTYDAVLLVLSRR
jgi:hypothetical protein